MSQPSAKSSINWLVADDSGVLRELADARRRVRCEPTTEAAAVALGVSLDEADAADPRGFVRRLQSEPTRTTFQAILAQLGADRLLLVLDWLTDSRKPHRANLLKPLFDREDGVGCDALQTAVLSAHRRALLTRMTSDLRLSSLVVCAVQRSHEKHARRTNP